MAKAWHTSLDSAGFRMALQAAQSWQTWQHRSARVPGSCASVTQLQCVACPPI